MYGSKSQQLIGIVLQAACQVVVVSYRNAWAGILTEGEAGVMPSVTAVDFMKWPVAM